VLLAVPIVFYLLAGYLISSSFGLESDELLFAQRWVIPQQDPLQLNIRTAYDASYVIELCWSIEKLAVSTTFAHVRFYRRSSENSSTFSIGYNDTDIGQARFKNRGAMGSYSNRLANSDRPYVYGHIRDRLGTGSVAKPDSNIGPNLFCKLVLDTKSMDTVQWIASLRPCPLGQSRVRVKFV